MRRQLLKAAAVASVALAAFVGACSLGLDASKLDVIAETGSDVTVDVATEADIPPGATRCTDDSNCGDKQCYSGKCDRGVCKVELCPAPQFPCQYQTCGGASCAQQVSHGLVAATMTLGHAGLGCSSSLNACVALVYPFAFVGPKTGDPAAYAVDDFAPADGGTASPAPVKLQNVDFTVSRIVASGTRVWFLGEVKLIGTVTQVPVAWIDVPYDSSLKTMTAVKGAMTLPSQTSVIYNAYPGADRGLLVLVSDAKGSPPSRVTQLKLVDGALNPATEFNPLPGLGAGASIVASSGDRLITARPVTGPPLAQYQVEIIRNAGAANVGGLGERDLSSALGPQALYPSVSFASTPSGGVLAQGAIAQREFIDGGPVVVGVDGVVVGWFLQQADDTTVESKGIAKVMAFPEAGVPAPDPYLIGPVTAIGEDKAIALQLQNDASVVQGVTRDPATKVTSLLQKSRGTLDLLPGAYVLRGARSELTLKEYAYAFSNPKSDADGVLLSVVRPGCGPL